MCQRRAAGLFVVFLAASLATVAPSSAQTTTCATSNCAVGMTGGIPNLPAACQNIATPRIIEISMTDSPSLRFIPSSIRIEGESTTPGVPWSYQCIQWHKIDVGMFPPPWHSATEDTTGSSCRTSDVPQCSVANITPPCDWETGNIDNALEFSVCHYASVPPASYHFRCRQHYLAGMNGSLTVVQPIQLIVDRAWLGMTC